MFGLVMLFLYNVEGGRGRGEGGGSVTTGDVSSEAIPGQSGKGERDRQRDRGCYP